jgi:Spy/CpxP family protein refolding chaperone
MKKLFIAALLFVGIASFAQDADMDQKPPREQRERLTPEQRNEKQLKKLTSDLSLDTKQQEQVKQLLAERSAKAEKFRDARKEQKESGTKPTAEQKEAFKKEMMAEKDANDAKMKGILTADQYTKWKASQEDHKEKFREKMKERRNDN